MFPDISFASSPILTTAVATALGLVGAGGIAAVVVPPIARRILPQPLETRLADFLPFDRILPDGQTVVCRDGTQCRMIAVSGIDQTFLHDQEAVSLYHARKNLLDSLNDTGVTLRIFTLREPISVETQEDYPNRHAQTIARRWNSNFEIAYRTRSVLVLSVKPGKDENRLDEAVGIVESALQQYRPVLLTQNPKTSPGADLTIGSFLGRLVSPLSQPRPKAFGDYLSDALAADEVEFQRNGRIVFRSGDRTKYCSVIGLRRLGDDTTTALANELSAIPGETVILQTVEPIPRAKALLTLKQQQRMMGATSFSPEVLHQYQAALEMVEGLDEDRASICWFYEVIFLYAETEEELARLEKSCRQILTNHGVNGVIEKGASQVSWFNQFPTYDVKPRPYRLMSNNIALLATFDRPPTGLPRSDWGPGAIAHFYTGANTVYQHQFHVSTEPAAVGHGLCIAPTGAGKTVLMTFLSCMASRHRHLRHFLFDRYQGCYIYTTAMGGQYLGFNAEKLTLSVRGGMNPLACEPTDENIEFLKVWLQAISGCSDHDSIEQIGAALEIAFSTLGKEERSLAAIYDGAFTPGSRLRDELAKWVDPAMYGEMFNAERDCIDLDDNWLTTFDMTKLLDDPLLAGASVGYIMHRIRQTLRRHKAPGFLFIDETEPLLRNQNFRNIYLVMLQEFRKLGGVVVSVFQRPDALKASGISELVRQQCGTYYLFPNPGANAADYAEFDLTDRELGFILGHTQPARRVTRGLLIKRPMTKESVIVDIDLGCLGPHLRLFSSSARDVGLASDLQRQFGGEAWVERYLDYEAP